MANRHMKRCSALLISKERQIDTALMNHLIPIRMAIFRHLMNNRCWRGCGEEGNPLTLFVEHKLVQSPWKTVWKFLKKRKTEYPYDIWSNHSSPDHISGKKKTIPWKDWCTPTFIAVKLTIAKTWEQPNCPSRDEWIKKMYLLIHTENGTPLRHLKNGIEKMAEE